MKRFASLLLSVLIVCLFCSCDSPSTMAEYLKYQQSPFSTEAIAVGTEEIRFSAEYDGENFSFLPVGAGTEAFSFAVKEGKLFLCCEDISIPLSSEAGHLAAKVYRMMTLDPSGVWQIVREKRDDGSAVCCECESYRLELDEKTGWPLRIVGEGIEVQVLSFSEK
ncbi:MAG: hypothetical protein KBS76_02590 [Ruminococcus sp.]|nr:hypothetical protein [Candidatus Apopatosoma intestinale]